MGLENLANLEPIHSKINKTTTIPEKVPTKLDFYGKSDIVSSGTIPIVNQNWHTHELRDRDWSELYNPDHTSDFDDKLNIRYGTPVGSFGMQEPYVVTDIGSRSNSDRIFTGDRGPKDALRIAKWYLSDNSTRWVYTQYAFQWLNPRGKRLWDESSILYGTPGIPGTNIKFRFNRAIDIDMFGITSGDKYTKTLAELNPDKGGTFDSAGKYGNKFQVYDSPEMNTKESKLNVAPIPWDNSLLPLPIRDQSVIQDRNETESVLYPTAGHTGFGHRKESGLSRRLTSSFLPVKPYGEHNSLILNSLYVNRPKIANTYDANSGIENNVYMRVGKFASKDLEDRLGGGGQFRRWITKTKTFGGYHQYPGPGADRDLSKETTYSEDIPRPNVNTSTDPRVRKFSGLLGKGFGDFFTNLEVDTGKDNTKKPNLTDQASTDMVEKIESSKNGMPFYFKDLRDNTYVFFRAYIDGLTENVSPTWSEHNYIGRSEPVYTYERATRDISFNLKLFAHSEAELENIYKKMTRLTSLCYPEYKQDIRLNNKTRMKPPLTRFRLGELYGSYGKEVAGFIKSLSYTFPDSSPWETYRKKRVPKHIVVAISYQIIHDLVPSLTFSKQTSGINSEESFYGITNRIGV